MHRSGWAVLLAVVLMGFGSTTQQAQAKLASSATTSDVSATLRGKLLPAPKCKIKRITASAKTGKIAAEGSCTVRGKRKVKGKYSFYRVPITWKYSYTAFDNQYACGSPRTGKTKNFTVKPPGAYRVAVRFTLTAKPIKGRAGAKPVSLSRPLVLGGRMAMCGKLGSVPLPPPEVMCQWPEGQFGVPCGTHDPGTTVAWSSPITMVDGLISAGNIVSMAANCWLEPLLNLPTYQWFGLTQQTNRLMCSDDKVYELQMWYLTMTNPRGEVCGPWRPPVVNIASFRIPLTIGGELRVMWQVGGGSGRDTTTAIIRLPGTEDGCPLMMSAGRPWPSNG